MTEPTDLAQLADDRLDGDIDDTNWARLIAEHGEALLVAERQARHLRGAIAALPRPSAPSDLATRVQAALPTEPQPKPTVIGPWRGLLLTSLPLAAAAAVLAIWLDRSDTGSDRLPTTRDSSANLAALRDQPTAEPEAAVRPAAPAQKRAETEEVASMMDRSADRQQSRALIEPARDEAIADGGRAMPEGRASDPLAASAASELADAVSAPPSATVPPIEPDAAVSAEMDFASSSVAAASAPVADRASDQPDTADIVAEAASAAPTPAAADITDAELAALRRDALAAQAKGLVPAEAGTERPSAQVALEALRSELRQRADPALELAMVCNLQGPERDELHLLLINGTREALPAGDLGLILQGVDADETVAWRRPLPLTNDRPLPAGGERSWTIPLRQDMAPPASVRQLRVATETGDQVSPSLTWPAEQ